MKAISMKIDLDSDIIIWRAGFQREEPEVYVG